MHTDHFVQSAPRLGNSYESDRVLRSWVRRHLPPPLLKETGDWLSRLGELSAGELREMQQRDRHLEPVLTRFDAWGRRIDRIELTPLWQRCRSLAAAEGLVARGYDDQPGGWARPVQFAGVYLFHPSSDVYTCPLAMTDGAARVLSDCDNRSLRDRALPRLLSRDPDQFWTSGQWMTEAAGGSDLGGTETVARRDSDHWRLFGKKWFTSAATSEMALTLARPDGQSSLALFYVETRRADGGFQDIELLRLKDKLGTRKLPTAEMLLNGTRATRVSGEDDGVRCIAPMLNVTRTWNSVCAIATMQRGIALARDFAGRRQVRGRPLLDLPLHAHTLAGLQAGFEAAFHLVFHQVRLMGQHEAGELAPADQTLLRLLIPLSKLSTGKLAVAISSEVIECFGGTGYVEDAGIAVLLRDAQVLPIWEGTTNVLSLDVLRVLDGGDAGNVYCERVAQLLDAASLCQQQFDLQAARRELAAVRQQLKDAVREAGARDLAMTMAGLMGFALLAEHAAHEASHHRDLRPLAAARRVLADGFMAQRRLGPGLDGENDQILAGDRI